MLLAAPLSLACGSPASVGSGKSPRSEPPSVRAGVSRPVDDARPSAASPPVRAEPAPSRACAAPSVELAGPHDSRGATPACERVVPIPGGTDPASCGSVPVDGGLERLNEAVPPLDEAVERRIASIARDGHELGRNRRAFGLVGDSITEGALFLGPFAAGAPQRVVLDGKVEAALTTRVDGEPATIIDYYRGAEVERLPGFVRDSFRATRAAEVGAPSRWALAAPPGRTSPLERMVERVNPAVAIVMYGSNDAVERVEPSDGLAARFERDLGAVVDELERRGIVPILSTIPRRGPQPDLRDCAPGLTHSDARMMVQTNVVSAVAAKLACERELPLIDLRHAFDGLASRGLFADGIHPSSHPEGSGLLTPSGLGCGYNTRNYLALRALLQVKESLERQGVWP